MTGVVPPYPHTSSRSSVEPPKQTACVAVWEIPGREKGTQSLGRGVASANEDASRSEMPP